ncbi:MAG TPA: carboxylesterase [Chloroflexi bacterium]|nr:carboxylesterase [Chloroflexota bacterium]
MSAIVSTAEPFFFPGGRTGCLLIHGFTGAPKEMREMGEYLNQRGYSVLGVRLTGHATQPEDMQRARWQDWLLSVEDGWHLLQGVTDRIFVCGLSMGGILSLSFAAQFPVAGVVAMSTPYELPHDPRLPYVRYLYHLQPKMAKGEPDWFDPEVAKDHVDYPYYPTRAIAELVELLKVLRASLPQVSAPVLLIHSLDDKGVAPENMKKIYAALGSPRKEMLMIENSGHAITRDQQRGQVFAAAEQFIRSVAE